MTAPANITESHSSFSRVQPWLVCLSAALFFSYEFIQMGMFNSISQELIQAFSINAKQLGLLSATYFYADVIFLLFAGILVDRISIRLIILTTMSFVVLATLLFAFSQSLRLAAFSHFIAGMGNAFCFLSCIKLAARWFPSKNLAFVTGVIITIAMVGGIVAQTPLTLLVKSIGWRHAMLANAGLGAIITLIVFIFVRDFPKHYFNAGKNSRLVPISTPLKKTIISVLVNKQNSLAGIYTCFLNLPIILLGELWGILYLTEVHHLNKTRASLVAAMVFLGTITGSPLVGWFSDYIGKRRLPMIMGALFSFFISLSIMLFNLHFLTLLTLFLLLGISTSTQIISYPLIAESNTAPLTGTATSLAAILIMGGGAVFQPLFGWLITLHNDHTLIQGAVSPNNYQQGMLIMPLACLVSLVAAFCLRETHCQPFPHE